MLRAEWQWQTRIRFDQAVDVLVLVESAGCIHDKRPHQPPAPAQSGGLVSKIDGLEHGSAAVEIVTADLSGSPKSSTPSRREDSEMASTRFACLRDESLREYQARCRSSGR